MLLRARILGKPAGLELAEAVGSLSGLTAQPADFPGGELCGQTGKEGPILAHSQLSPVSWTLPGAYRWL